MSLNESNIMTLNTTQFESITEPENTCVEMKSSYKLSDANIGNLPDDTRDMDSLRCRLSEYLDKFEKGYIDLELKCDIKRDTFQKAIKFKNGINITYTFLAKFCLGAQLTLEETKELFAFNGHLLNEKDLYDYIFICEIENKGTIEDFDEDLTSRGYKGILSDPVGRRSKNEDNK